MFLLRGLKKNNIDKENYDEFCKVYFEWFRKDNNNDLRKNIIFTNKYFTRKNFRLMIMEQIGNSCTMQYDSYSASSTGGIKELSSPSGHQSNSSYFSSTSHKLLFDTVFGSTVYILNETATKTKIHIIKQDNLILLTLLYPSYSQILKRIRSLSHSPSLSRSSSLGDYVSLNMLTTESNSTTGNSVSIATAAASAVSSNDLVPMGTHGSTKRVAICLAWTCNLDDLNLIFRFALTIFIFLSQLAEKVGQHHQDNGSICCDKMHKLRHWFTDTLRNYFVSPRLLLPVWVTLNTLQHYHWFACAEGLTNMRRVFVEKILVYLINKMHCKERDFVLAKLLTVVLMYHQGWIHNVDSTAHYRHRRLFTAYPGVCRQFTAVHNPLLSQLASGVLGRGSSNLSRTVITSSHSQLMNLLLYFTSYFIRFSALTVRLEDTPDASQLTTQYSWEARSGSTGNLSAPGTSHRRKCASYTEYSTPAVSASHRLHQADSSLEDLSSTRLGLPSTLPRSVGSSSVAGGGGGNLSVNNSPVREPLCPEGLQVKLFYPPETLKNIDQMAQDYVSSKNKHAKPLPPTAAPTSEPPRLFVREVPLLLGGKSKSETDALQHTPGHMGMCASCDVLVPGPTALQGLVTSSSLTTLPDLVAEELRLLLRHSYSMFQTSRRTDLADLTCSDSFYEWERPQYASAILMNADKSTINLVTVSNDNRTEALVQEINTPSPLVMGMLDQAQSISHSCNDASLVLHAVELQLARIYRLSYALVNYIRDCRRHPAAPGGGDDADNLRMAKSINCHIDDIPLLYATALAHSPDIYHDDDSWLSSQ